MIDYSQFDNIPTSEIFQDLAEAAQYRVYAETALRLGVTDYTRGGLTLQEIIDANTRQIDTMQRILIYREVHNCVSSRVTVRRLDHKA